jgi:hypothetical protein
MEEMDRLLDGKISSPVIGFCQGLLVFVYTIFIAVFIASLGNFENKLPEYVVIPIMLSLLVLSAGVTGTLVFGLPVYFTFAKNNVKKALEVLAYTFLFILIAVLTAACLIITFSQ